MTVDLNQYPHAMDVDSSTGKPMQKVSVLLKSSDIGEVTLQNNVTAVGNGSTLDVNGKATVVFSVTGTFVGTVIFEGSINDVDWFPILTTQFGSGVISNSVTTTGLYRGAVAGLKSVRARVSAYTSGSIKVVGRATVVDSSTKSVQIAGASSTGGAMPVTLQGLDANGNLKVTVDSANAIIPVAIQDRLPRTIVTQTGAVVTPNGGANLSSWIDTDGFDKVAVKANSNSALSWEIRVSWSDDNGVSVTGQELGGANVSNNKVYKLDTAARYMRVDLINRDPSSPQTMNGSAYLKS
jgi:hypothetical protein